MNTTDPQPEGTLPNDSRQTASDCVREPAPMAAGGDLNQRIESVAELRRRAEYLVGEARRQRRSMSDGISDYSKGFFAGELFALDRLFPGILKRPSEQTTAASNVPPSGPQNLEPPAAISVLNEPGSDK